MLHMVRNTPVTAKDYKGTFALGRGGATEAPVSSLFFSCSRQKERHNRSLFGPRLLFTHPARAAGFGAD
jgi:hypothetical protein